MGLHLYLKCAGPKVACYQRSRLLGGSRCLCWNQRRSAHTFENTTEIAVGGNDSRGVVLEGGARDVEAAQEQVKVLRVGRAVGVGVNTRGFRVGLAFDLQRVTVGTGNNRRHFAFFLSADVGRLAVALGTESSCDVVALARHPLNNFLSYRRIILTALKPLIE